MKSRVITEIEDQIYAEGYRPGTPQFEYMFRKRRVERCQEMRGVRSCQACHYFDSCELVKLYLRDIAEMKMRRHVAMEKQKAHAEALARSGRDPLPVYPLPRVEGPEIPGGLGTGNNPFTNTSWYPDEATTRSPSQSDDGSGLHPPWGPGLRK